MATILRSSLNMMLSGSIFFQSSGIRMALSTENPWEGTQPKRFLSDIGVINHTSNTVFPNIVRDTGAYDSTRSVYLCAFKLTFSDVTTDYTNRYANFYLYLDSGNPSTSPLLSYHNPYSPDIYGKVEYTFSNQTRVFRLRDFSFSSNRTLFRTFREKLFKNEIGNLQTLNIKVALMNQSYAFNVQTQQYYSDISSNVVATSNQINNLFIEDGSLKSGTSFIGFLNLTGPQINSTVFYIDSGDPTTSLLIGYYDSTTITGFPFIPDGNNFTLRLNANTIFQL